MNTHDALRSVDRFLFPAFLSVLCLFPFGCGDAKPPPEDEGHVEQEAHTDVVLTPALLENAGIETAEAGPSRLVLTLRLTATVVDNVDAEVHINPRVGGLVRVIHTKLGDSVAPGDPLCEIDSVQLGNAVSDFLKARAVAQAAEETRDKTRRLYEARLATRQQILDGAVAIAEAIFAREKDLRDREITTLRPYLEAEKALKEAKFTRERDMTGLRAERDSRLLELEVALRTAQVELNTAENRLHIYGFTHEELASLKDEQGVNVGRYLIRSPVAGIITARHITLNEFVDTSTELFEIDDLSRSWIVASVYEKDLARIVRGQEASVRLEAFPNVTFRGAVSYVSHSVDTSTRAARVRVEVDNEPIPQWKEPFPIRPGMFGVADLALESIEVPVAVPAGAVVREGEELYVFVRESELVFERRDVGVGRQSRERVEVVSGLEPGESVVTAGTFILKSMLHKGELGGGHEH